MPFNVEAPMVETQSPKRYPAPDWSKTATVREAWLPDEPSFGWLVLQDDTALSWVCSVGDDRPAAYAVRNIVEESIRSSLAQNRTAQEAYNEAVDTVMFRPAETMDLQDLVEQLQKAWS